MSDQSNKVTIGDVEGGIHGSIIAGGDVKDVQLFQTGDVSGSYNVIGHGASLVIQQIEALSPAAAAQKAEEVAHRRLAQAIKAKVESYQRLVKKSDAERRNPYKSLNFYRLEDAPYFYGREQAIPTLLDQLHQRRLTILYADSGAGKSSLLQAGIQARLLAAGHLPVDVRLRGQEPVSHILKKALAPELAAELSAEPLDTFLTKVNRQLGQSNLYLFLDQFEEFFLKLPPERQKNFVTELNTCLDQSELDVRWVLSLRGEYLYRLHVFGSHVRTNEYYLSPFTKTEARQVIIQPAQAQQTRYEAGLVDDILADLARQVEGPAEGYAPPQVQLVCHTLFETVKTQPPPRTITTTVYDAAGKAGGILTSHLGRTIKKLPSRLEQDIAHELLEALVTVSLEKQRMRDARSETELAAEVQQRLHRAGPEQVKPVLQFLVDNYLLRTEHDLDQGDRYELTHDYLLGEIELDPATQQRKLAEQMLRQEVDSYLSSGKQTRIAADKLALIEPHVENMVLDDEAEELLAVSRAAVKRQKQFVLGGVSLVAVLVVIAIASVVVMFGAQRAADEAEQREAAAIATAVEAIDIQSGAEAQAEAAATQVIIAQQTVTAADELRQTSERAAASARQNLVQLNRMAASTEKADLSLRWGHSNMERALFYAIQAAHITPTIRAERALRTSLAYPLRAVLEAGHERLAVSPDSRYLALDSAEDAVQIWALTEPPELVQTLTITGGSISGLEFHPTRPQLLVVDGYLTEQMQLWPVGAEAPKWQLDKVQEAQFSPEGQFVWLKNSDSEASRLAHAASGEALLLFDETRSGAFSPDDQYLLVAGSDYTTRRLIVTATGSPVYTLTNADLVEFSPQGTYLLVHNWQTRQTDILTTTTGQINQSFSDVDVEFVQPDDRYLAVYGDLERPRILSAASGELQVRLGGGPDNLMQPQVSPSGQYLAALSSDETVRVWGFDEGLGRFYTLTDPTGPINAFHFHANETQLITLANTRRQMDPTPADQTTRIWDIVRESELAAYKNNRSRLLTPDQRQVIELKNDGVTWLHTTILTTAHRTIDSVTSLLDADFNPDGRHIRTRGRRDSGWRLWDTATGDFVEHLQDIAFSPDGRAVAKIDNQRQAGLWLEGEPVSQVRVNEAFEIQFSPAGQWLSIAASAGPGIYDQSKVQLFTTAGDPVTTFNDTSGLVFSLDDDQAALLDGAANTAQIWQLRPTVQPLYTLTNIIALQYNPAGETLAARFTDNRVALLDSSGGQPLYSLGKAASFNFSPAGHYMQLESKDYQIKTVAAVESGQPLFTIADARAVTFSPDDHLMVVTLQNGLAEVHPLPTGDAFFLEGHTGAITGVAFSTDGRYLATASDDQTARIWDAATGEEVATLAGHRNFVSGVEFSPDGQLVLTYSWDGSARIWNFPPVEQLLEQARQRIRPSWRAQLE